MDLDFFCRRSAACACSLLCCTPFSSLNAVLERFVSICLILCSARQVMFEPQRFSRAQTSHHRTFLLTSRIALHSAHGIRRKRLILSGSFSTTSLARLNGEFAPSTRRVCSRCSCCSPTFSSYKYLLPPPTFFLPSFLSFFSPIYIIILFSSADGGQCPSRGLSRSWAELLCWCVCVRQRVCLFSWFLSLPVSPLSTFRLLPFVSNLESLRMIELINNVHTGLWELRLIKPPSDKQVVERHRQPKVCCEIRSADLEPT